MWVCAGVAFAYPSSSRAAGRVTRRVWPAESRSRTAPPWRRSSTHAPLSQRLDRCHPERPTGVSPAVNRDLPRLLAPSGRVWPRESAERPPGRIRRPGYGSGPTASLHQTGRRGTHPLVGRSGGLAGRPHRVRCRRGHPSGSGSGNRVQGRSARSVLACLQVYTAVRLYGSGLGWSR
jgi:hypothetical protein